jgi:indolepyruvate ferredoxin oxidoreductase
MVNWMGRHTSTITQMGSEGINWLGQRHFVKEKHVFVNLGDGTYFHSGLLAIRAAIADQANMTYKILYNDAIAMTGGQPVEGNLSVPQIVQQVLAEGAAEVAVVSDDPEKYNHTNFALPGNVKAHHRDQLDQVQRHLRNVAGVTILIYDQACATERRRKRKRGLLPDQAKRAYIHPEICEGCGDCSAQSNCLSVEPLETELGTKRQINQSSCNKDFSCVKGFCPSFVTLEGAEIRKPERYQAETLPTLAEPTLDHSLAHYSILVTGVGGTGVITIGALLGMAAHLDHKGVSVLDVTGLAQKGGAVASHIQLSAQPDEIHATRISAARADLLIGCDAIVSTGTEALKALHKNTRAIVNLAPIPTAAMVQQPNWHFPASTCEKTLQQIVGNQCEFFDANAIALAALGDAIYANPIILGYAWQKGWIPLSLKALLKAIELNGVAVAQNKMAFDWGRHAAHDLTATYSRLGIKPTPTPAQIMQLDSPGVRQQTLLNTLEDRMQRLTAYQNAAYAQTYRQLLAPLLERDQQLGNSQLSLIAARQLYRLMAIKDEYEIARLFKQPSFHQALRQQFSGEPGKNYQIRFHLAPPILSKGADKPRKIAFGRWITPLFSLLAQMKFLRNTPFDIFSYHHERRQERLLLADYQALLSEIAAQLNPDNYQLACQLLALPEQVKGYGYVRMANLEKMRPQWQTLHQQWRQAKTTPSLAA